MPDFNIRSDSVNVEQIMEQIRARIQDQRGVDYSLYFEVVHNLVFELTRAGIELKNLKMRVESLAGRVEFNERRARALESVVVYKPEGGTRTPVERAPAVSAPQPPPPAA